MRLLLTAFSIWFFSGLSSAQPVYRNLVLEGAGVRGFAYSGAFAVLDSMGILKDIDRVGGTSAGAIEATLLAVGYAPDEITASAYKAPLQHFNDAGFLYLGTLKRFREQFGLFKGDKISSWIGELIAAKTGNGNITFGELHRERV